MFTTFRVSSKPVNLSNNNMHQENIKFEIVQTMRQRGIGNFTTDLLLYGEGNCLLLILETVRCSYSKSLMLFITAGIMVALGLTCVMKLFSALLFTGISFIFKCVFLCTYFASLIL